jgi:hypothetical protein
MPAATSHEFASALAERLNAVAPAEFSVAADDVDVVMTYRGQWVGSTGMAELVESSENLDHLPDNLATAAEAIMASVQDWIADSTGRPWPGTRSQPNPHAAVCGNQLSMWFGDDPGAPTLALPDLTVPAAVATD